MAGASRSYNFEQNGCHAIKMGGREYKGYVQVDKDSIKNKKDFDYWDGLALDINKIAKSSKKQALNHKIRP